MEQVSSSGNWLVVDDTTESQSGHEKKMTEEAGPTDQPTSALVVCSSTERKYEELYFRFSNEYSTLMITNRCVYICWELLSLCKPTTSRSIIRVK